MGIRETCELTGRSLWRRSMRGAPRQPAGVAGSLGRNPPDARRDNRFVDRFSVCLLSRGRPCSFPAKGPDYSRPAPNKEEKQYMKWQFAAVVVAAMFAASPALAQGCDTKPGRPGGQQTCSGGKICTGPYEGSYKHGNCQPKKGCDTKPGRPGGKASCPRHMVCTGPFEGSYGRGHCRPK